ncbi:sporulation histidine kinase inhibitor Sda [Halobacillus litoralis]|nr:sporulation histidine kinase inhibitor Sda [Halobacillus litoralis]MCA0971182.1 sporulation histidine kinase inhibitor Sda [Halobacillus litoralis]
MHELNDNLLVVSLYRARELQLDYEFIELLEKEMMNREQREPTTAQD